MNSKREKHKKRLSQIVYKSECFDDAALLELQNCKTNRDIKEFENRHSLNFEKHRLIKELEKSKENSELYASRILSTSSFSELYKIRSSIPILKEYLQLRKKSKLQSLLKHTDIIGDDVYNSINEAISYHHLNIQFDIGLSKILKMEKQSGNKSKSVRAISTPMGGMSK